MTLRRRECVDLWSREYDQPRRIQQFSIQGFRFKLDSFSALKHPINCFNYTIILGIICIPFSVGILNPPPLCLPDGKPILGCSNRWEAKRLRGLQINAA